MCDYSLAAMRTRLAVEGEELIVYRFPTGSLGLTSPSELEGHKQKQPGWRFRFNPREAPCAVCIPPYARLSLRDIPERLQRELGVGATEEVVFIQMHNISGRHRDGVQFRNNQEILLQQLTEGQRVAVLSLSSATSRDEEIDVLYESTVPVV
jgi:hypothetical protein